MPKSATEKEYPHRTFSCLCKKVKELDRRRTSKSTENQQETGRNTASSTTKKEKKSAKPVNFCLQTRK
ncbi:hypothetical protein D6817_04220 [Candidatus Pacearchaeota archaeon]|nr:MAG: hypothetical protein D6817_04220 [Candidatus Pacearchaeota archaeon]